MRLVVTGATGFLGWRATVLLRERGHDVLAVARPGAADRAHARGLEGLVHVHPGPPEARGLPAGPDAVLHFAGVPDPAGARRDPANAIRANVGTTANLLEGCLQHGAALVYPSSVRGGLEPPPDPYALSKRLGEEACRLHQAPTAAVRLPGGFGPRPGHGGGRARAHPRLRRPRVGRRADRHPRRSAAHARLRLRRRRS